MLPYGYDPQNYGGKVWWNENNIEMRTIWGTQADYDKHILQGGTWEEYEELVKLRMKSLEEKILEDLSVATKKAFDSLDNGKTR